MTEFIRYKCDKCNAESNEASNYNGLEVSLDQFDILIEVTYHSTVDSEVENKQHLCKYCLIEAIKGEDDRPKDASEYNLKERIKRNKE